VLCAVHLHVLDLDRQGRRCRPVPTRGLVPLHLPIVRGSKGEASGNFLVKHRGRGYHYGRPTLCPFNGGVHPRVGFISVS